MIIGVDLGTRRIALVALAGAQVGAMAAYRVPDTGKKKVSIERAGYELGAWAADWIFQNVPDREPVSYAERPFVGRPHGNVRTAIGQALTVGGVLAQLPGVSHLIEQAEWKAAIVGNGHAGKADIAAWLATNHPALSAAADGDQDLVDASCIALYGHRLAEGR